MPKPMPFKARCPVCQQLLFRRMRALAIWDLRKHLKDAHRMTTSDEFAGEYVTPLGCVDLHISEYAR